VDICVSGGMNTAQPCYRCACVGWIESQGRAPDLGPDLQATACHPRHLFDWLVTGQVVPVNPAASVRDPRHVLRSGKTAVLEVIHIQFKRRLFLGPSAFAVTDPTTVP
jgi:hypothetical protein